MNDFNVGDTVYFVRDIDEHPISSGTIISKVEKFFRVNDYAYSSILLTQDEIYASKQDATDAWESFMDAEISEAKKNLKRLTNLRVKGRKYIAKMQ